MAVVAINGDHVVGVMFGFQIEDQRRVSVGAESSGGERRPFKAMGSVLLQDPPGRPCGICQVIGHVVKEALNSMRTLEAAKFAKFGGSEAVVGVAHL